MLPLDLPRPDLHRRHPGARAELRQRLVAAARDAMGRPWATLLAGPEGFAITQCYIKPYACCRHFHAALDALFWILDDEGLDPAAVEKVEVGTYAFAAAHGSAGWDNSATAQLCVCNELHFDRRG